ncbi:MAG TPA: hypothetical protein VMH81_04280 [Bryobacteraceae bacterium]|nr:hypothetical protein [Bryobacteraceae bacterium]
MRSGRRIVTLAPALVPSVPAGPISFRGDLKTDATLLLGATCSSGANTNIDTGFCFDVQLDGGTPGPGDYTIAISAFSNQSFVESLGTGTLADGFTGLGNLFEGEDLR